MTWVLGGLQVLILIDLNRLHSKVDRLLEQKRHEEPPSNVEFEQLLELENNENEK